MCTLTRYVLGELCKVFLVALTGLTMLMIIVGVVKEALNQSLPVTQIAQLVPYVLPDALRVALPVTLLLATTTVYARMSGSNEIVAIKSLGISPLVILWPAFVMAFLLSLATVWLNDKAVSWGRAGVQRVVTEAVEEIAYSMLRTQHCYSSSRFAINVKRVEGRRLIRVTLSLQGHDNSPPITLTAEEAELRSDPAENVLRIILRNATGDVQGRVRFQDPGVYEQKVVLREASQQGEALLPSWLPLHVIPEQTTQQRALIKQYEKELAARAAYQMLCGNFEQLTGPEWPARAGSLNYMRNHLHRLLTEPHRRWSTGFSCFFFVLVGAPLAIRLRNGELLTSFFLCFLPILVVYYPLMVYGVDGSKHGTIPPWSVWTGNVLLLVWGTYLLRKVLRY